MFVLQAVELYRFFHVGEEKIRALRGVSLTVEAGEFVAVMGPSGSGKSTLLNCLAGLDEPDGGHVMLGGERLARRPDAPRAALRARHIGMLLQSGNLFDHLTVAENIRLQIALAGGPAIDPVQDLTAALGVEKRLDALPDQLSGGDAARAGLAVAFAISPAILLADEPTAEVDEATGNVIVDHLVAHSNTGKAVLAVTHHDAVARRADRIVEMWDGKIVDARASG
jgi:putative ABC transport system ATP-binding protein